LSAEDGVDPDPGLPPVGDEDEAIVKVVVLCAEELARLVAATWKTVPALAFGAVNRPALEMTPPLADQVTPVLLVLLTSAENCSFPPAVTDGFAGEICTVAQLKQEFIGSV
jgi:hypothetical protein